MSPEIVDLTVSPPSSPTTRTRPIPSSSSAAAMPNQPRRVLHSYLDMTTKGYSYIEGIAKCGMGNWHRMAEKFVKTKTPQQICNYSVEYFRRVRSTSLRETRYIEAKSRSETTSVGPSNKMDMINVAPRAKNPATKCLRKLVTRGALGSNSES
ncbi:hypothetical protein M0R45_003804 [Rubus argutus]|uniref:SANT domain-containing protein n=1 Tax=Rubus argutus TaxID=59490 RepID=A0AAW1YGI0_RUBAR